LKLVHRILGGYKILFPKQEGRRAQWLNVICTTQVLLLLAYLLAGVLSIQNTGEPLAGYLETHWMGILAGILTELVFISVSFSLWKGAPLVLTLRLEHYYSESWETLSTSWGRTDLLSQLSKFIGALDILLILLISFSALVLGFDFLRWGWLKLRLARLPLKKKNLLENE